MSLLLLQLFNGLQFGMVLFLIAAGLTLVFGVMNTINLAHGAQYMLGAYAAVISYQATGHFGISLLFATGVSVFCGALLSYVFMNTLRQMSHLAQVLATFGLMLVIVEGVKIVWGTLPQTMPRPEIFSGSIALDIGLLYPHYRLVLVGLGIGSAVCMGIVIFKTRFGMYLRAVATHPQTLRAMGCNDARIFHGVFVLASMLSGVAGALAAPVISVDPNMGDKVLILSFVVVILGGLGSIRGAFLAAMIVGVIETIGRAYAVDVLKLLLSPGMATSVGPALASILIYAVMVAVLMLRPHGLYGVKP